MRLIALMLAASVAFAQAPPGPPPSGFVAPAFSQQELDQMLAPVALYPDSLLSQILMAATYPLEIVDAARWSMANPGLRGEEAVRAAGAQPWDPSVKSLLAFPQILAMMDQRLDWTQRLGNAFLAQQAQVMDTVQALRRRAYDAGNLRSDSQMSVSDQQGWLEIDPFDPQSVYVPYYDPLAVYGPWWWSAYPPIRWAAWPGYYTGPGFAAGFAWGSAVAITAGFFFGACDWRLHRVDVVKVDNFYYRGTRVNTAPGAWQHDAEHRRGVPYRGATVRQQFGPASQPAAAAEARREFRGREPSALAIPAVPAARPGPARFAAPEPAPRALEGIRAGGGQTREFSARGNASIQPRVEPPHAAPAPRSFTPPAGGARNQRR